MNKKYRLVAGFLSLALTVGCLHFVNPSQAQLAGGSFSFEGAKYEGWDEAVLETIGSALEFNFSTWLHDYKTYNGYDYFATKNCYERWGVPSIKEAYFLYGAEFIKKPYFWFLKNSFLAVERNEATDEEIAEKYKDMFAPLSDEYHTIHYQTEDQILKYDVKKRWSEELNKIFGWEPEGVDVGPEWEEWKDHYLATGEDLYEDQYTAMAYAIYGNDDRYGLVDCHNGDMKTKTPAWYYWRYFACDEALPSDYPYTKDQCVEIYNNFVQTFDQEDIQKYRKKLNSYTVLSVYKCYGAKVANDYIKALQKDIPNADDWVAWYDRKKNLCDIMEASSKKLDNLGLQFVDKEMSDAGITLDQWFITPSEAIDTQETTPTFSDVSSDAWYYDAVNALTKSGILNGYEDGTFRPNNPITIGEMCAIVWRIVGDKVPTGKWTDEALLERPYRSHWASIYEEYCSSYGYIASDYFLYDADKGLNKGLDENAMRAEAISIVVQIVKYDSNAEYWIDKLNTRQQTNGRRTDWTLEQIPDYEAMMPWTERRIHALSRSFITIRRLDYEVRTGYLYNVSFAYNLGIANGIDEQGTSNGTASVTRAEFCQMLFNAMSAEKHPVEPHNWGFVGS